MRVSKGWRRGLICTPPFLVKPDRNTRPPASDVYGVVWFCAGALGAGVAGAGVEGAGAGVAGCVDGAGGGLAGDEVVPVGLGLVPPIKYATAERMTIAAMTMMTVRLFMCAPPRVTTMPTSALVSAHKNVFSA